MQYQFIRISIMAVGKTLYQTTAYYDFQDGAKTKWWNCLKKSCRIRLLIFPVAYSGLILWYPYFIFSFILLDFGHLYKWGKVSILSMFRFLETNIREQQMYEKRIQASLKNTVNNLCYEIKFDIRMKDKNTFFIEQNISFLF